MTEKSTVVLLHGLARSSRSMRKLELALQQAGFHTVNINYPSTRNGIQVLSETVIRQALSQCQSDHTVHFVTHSLGGILLRCYLSLHTIDKLGRVVMLAPPNRGSQLADWLQNYWLYRRTFGPVGAELGTTADSLVNQLGPAHFELGIIAGTRAINLLFSPFIPKPNDGTVSVENTKIEGMTDHLCLPVTHPLLMRNPQVITQVLHFLKQGRFCH